MSEQRHKRLTKLVQVQRQVQALHETRHANHIANANAAEQDAQELIARFDGGTPMASLFPELYHQRISRAYTRRDENKAHAEQEAVRVVAATLRAEKVDKARREIGHELQEKNEQRMRLEIASRRRGDAK